MSSASIFFWQVQLSRYLSKYHEERVPAAFAAFSSPLYRLCVSNANLNRISEERRRRGEKVRGERGRREEDEEG